MIPLHLNYAHLTANPLLAFSRHTFLGRNDSAIALASHFAGLSTHTNARSDRQILILGSGVIEPLVCLLSPHVQCDVGITSVDSDIECSALLSDLARSKSVIIPHTWLSMFDLHSSRACGVDWLGEALLKPFKLSPNTAKRLFHARADAISCVKVITTKHAEFDLIVLNNILPSLIAQYHPGEIQTFLLSLVSLLKVTGCLLLGATDSILYPTQQNLPQNSLSSIRTLLSSIPLHIHLWINRSIVNESHRHLLLVDGYSYLFLTQHNQALSHTIAGRIAVAIRSALSSSLPALKPTLKRMDPITTSTTNYIWVSFNDSFCSVSVLDSPFPGPALRMASNADSTQFRPRILESIVSTIAAR